MKLSKDKRNQLILVGLVAVALSAVIWQMLIKVAIQELAKQADLGQKAERRLKDAQSFLSSADTLQSQASTYSNALIQLEAEMANAADPYTWCVQLMQKAAEGHEDVVIQEVTAPLTPAALDSIAEFPYEAIVFGVRGRAHWEDLGRFVADFENRYPFLSTRQLQIGSAVKRELVGDNDTATAEPVNSEVLNFSMNVVALVKPVP